MKQNYNSLRNFAVAAVILITSSIMACGHPMKNNVLVARCTLHDAQGKPVATAILTETSDGVRIELTVDSLPPGVHAFHIHDKGDCTAPDFKSAGGHYNPYKKEHGRENPKGHHAGDMPNIKVGPDGKAEVVVAVKGVSLFKGVDGTLFDEDGSALVIHAGADDNVSDPAGNAGARIACGIIRR